MKIFLGVILTVFVLLLLFCSFFFLRVWVSVAYKDRPTLKLKILFFSFKIFPREKKRKLEKYTPKKHSSTDNAKRKQKKDKKNKANSKTAKPKERKKLPEILAFYRELIETVIVPMLGRLGKHLVIRIDRLMLGIGTDDSSKTAVLYGGVIAGAEGLIQLLSSCCTLKFGKDRDISVSARFDRNVSDVDIQLSLSLKPWHALHIVLPALVDFLRVKECFSSSDKDTQTQKIQKI